MTSHIHDTPILDAHLLEERIHVAQGYYHLRPLVEEDRGHVLDLFDHLSDKSRYYRYAQQLKTLPESLLKRIISAHHRNDLALGAFLYDNDGQDALLIGIARYVKEGQDHVAEFSLSVRDDFQHEGIGSKLMRSMLDAAKRNGFREVNGYVMADNHDMLTLMTHLGAKTHRDEDDHTTIITTFQL